jgi:hypothetical protein
MQIRAGSHAELLRGGTADGSETEGGARRISRIAGRRLAAAGEQGKDCEAAHEVAEHSILRRRLAEC